MKISRSQHHTPQSSFSRSEGEREYQRLENQILRKTGVTCSVLVKPEVILIRTASYADYVLAKKCIKGGVSLPIVRDE